MALTHKHAAVAPLPSTMNTAAGLAPVAARAVAVLRIAFGLTFLWAFLDKLLALGWSTGRDDDGTVDRFGDAAWIHGGSPTEGFLKFGADGPLQSFYNNLAGAWWVDALFMFALLGLGLALTFGFAMRIAAVGGAVLYLMMWSVVLPPATNPVIDDHILGAITLVVLGLLGAGGTWGVGTWLERTELVRRFPVLR